jgi:hypothetical protein
VISSRQMPKNLVEDRGQVPIRRFAWLALAVAFVSPTCAGSIESPPSPWAARRADDSIRVAAIEQTASATDNAWWTRFEDSTLNVLVQSACVHARSLSNPGRTLAHRATLECGVQPACHPAGTGDGGAPCNSSTSTEVQSQVVSAYLDARVLTIRVATARSIYLTTRRQVELQPDDPDLAAQGAEPAAPNGRVRLAAEAASRLHAELQRQLVLLANLSGIDVAAIPSTLADALSASVLPKYASAVPTRLPSAVIRGRREIAAVEASLLRGTASSASGRHALAQYVRAMEGWIEPLPLPTHGPSSEEPARPRVSSVAMVNEGAGPDSVVHEEPYADVLTRMTQDVSDKLFRLLRDDRAAALHQQLFELRRLEFNAVRQRQQFGEATELELLERHIQLLRETDRLAKSVGDLGQSWVALNVATAGRASQRVNPAHASP